MASLTRRQLAARAIGLAAALSGPGCARDEREPGPGPYDAVARRTLAELASFTGWLRRHGARGFVGEVGWPGSRGGDGARWQRLAERWYALADLEDLWVTHWATGEWWPATYPLLSYASATGQGPVDTPRRPAAIVEAHLDAALSGRGVNVAGGAFGAPSVEPRASFSNLHPGRVEVDYHYDGPSTYRYLAARGLRLVRIEFRWERLQPALGEAFDPGELGRVRAAMGAAISAGHRVILDVHNYGGYYLDEAGGGVRHPVGSAAVPEDAFADLWSRLSATFAGHGGIAAYGLMNEPAALAPAGTLSAAQVWEAAARAALAAIRAGGDATLVMVPGYEYSGVDRWTQTHPRPWVADPADNIRYEAHHYWDWDHSSLYALSYAAQERRIRAATPG